MRHSSIETSVNALYTELKADEEITDKFKVCITHYIFMYNIYIHNLVRG